MKRKIVLLGLFLCSCLFYMLGNCTVIKADTGPKPSVQITIEGLPEDTLCFGTLLSDKPSTGPSREWDKSEEEAYLLGNYESTPSDEWNKYDIFQAMAEYVLGDDYYLLNWVWFIGDSHELNWTYFPPQRFKILLYFPEENRFFISEVCERYAFDSYFTAQLTEDNVIVKADKEPENNADTDTASGGMTDHADNLIQVERSYSYGREILSFCIRILITLAIETLIVFLFGIRKKKLLLNWIFINAVTQTVLNVMLNAVVFFHGDISYILWYAFLEIVVIFAEANYMCRATAKYEDAKIQKKYLVVAVIVANILSFLAGYGLADIVPELF